MSTQVVCPLCANVSKHVSVPDPRWGYLFDDEQCERIWMCDYDVDMPGIATIRDVGARVAKLMHDLGKETFACPCGNALWVQGRGWMISFERVSQLRSIAGLLRVKKKPE